MTPLKPVDFLILLSLVAGERHGYGILGAVSELTDGELELDPGNLYRSLKRLLEAKLIQKASRKPSPESNDERRQYYRLSAAGRRTAAAEARRMDAILALDPAKKLLGEGKA